MPAWSWISDVLDTISRILAWIVHGQLLASGVESVLLAAAAKLLGSFLDAIRQDIANPFSVDDHLHQSLDSLRVAPAEPQSAGILFGDKPVLKAVNGERYNRSKRDRIDTRAVQVLIYKLNCVEITDQKKSTKCIGGLV